MTSLCLVYKLSTLFVVCRVLIANISLKWRLNLGFGNQKMCSFIMLYKEVEFVNKISPV